VPHVKKCTNEEIVGAYKRTGSVWRAAKDLGMCGQTVWERLKRLDYRLPGEAWTEEEAEELRLLAPNCTIGEIARRLGRPYGGVATKISELGIGVRYGNRTRTKLQIGTGLTKAAMTAYFKDLAVWGGSILQFCRQRGLDIEQFVKAAQKHRPEEWKLYVQAHSDIEPKTCPQCSVEFIPMNQKQATCSRRCSTLRRVDKQYFGGKRSLAVGMTEGVCQLCERDRPKLAAHHVYGKENDPDNEVMVALCPGCHGLVGNLGTRKDCTSPAFWENLIALASLRKHGHGRPLGFHVTVEIEEMSEEDFEVEEITP
jgi:hypothetical protein